MIGIFNIGNTQPDAKMMEIAAWVRQRRLEMNLTQASLAKRADIPLPTYRLFEKSGKVSLQGLLCRTGRFTWRSTPKLFVKDGEEARQKIYLKR